MQMITVTLILYLFNFIQFSVFSSPQFPETDDVVFTDRHGKTSTISKAELLRMIENSENTVEKPQNKINEIKEEKVSMDEIRKSNPEMSSFIGVAKWALQKLRDADIVDKSGRIQQLRSLPFGGSINRASDDTALDMKRWKTMWIELSVRFDDDTRHENIEIMIEKDYKYAKPYVAILSAWRLNTNGERVKELNVPPVRFRVSPMKYIEDLILRPLGIFAVFAALVALCRFAIAMAAPSFSGGSTIQKED